MNNLNISLPIHVGIIMDGNGRWAKKRMMPRYFGHTVGAETLKKIISYAQKKNIKFLTIYAFSTENWNRSKFEVDNIMRIFTKKIKETIENISKINLKINFLGDFSGISNEIINLMDELKNKCSNNIGMTLNIAFSYGSKKEILNSVKLICKDVINKKLNYKEIDYKIFSDYLYTKGQPDIDLVIRTAGELRISNFFLWQCAYSEFYFTDVLWPDFSCENFDDALNSFSNRVRKFGFDK